MKKATLTLLAIVAAQIATAAPASAGPETARPEISRSYTVVLAGSGTQNTIEISLSTDGSEYVIISAVPLEVGGTVCENVNSTTLVCKAPMVAGFEVNAGGGNDTITVTRDVTVPVTLHGGPGNDALVGGDGPDELVGGPGEDRLVGRAGDDLILGCPGNDEIFGGLGSDTLRGGRGKDLIAGGPGNDDIRQDPTV
jgi:Ca2+-binding RTX toxin-like protein